MNLKERINRDCLNIKRVNLKRCILFVHILSSCDVIGRLQIQANFVLHHQSLVSEWTLKPNLRIFPNLPGKHTMLLIGDIQYTIVIATMKKKIFNHLNLPREFSSAAFEGCII